MKLNQIYTIRNRACFPLVPLCGSLGFAFPSYPQIWDNPSKSIGIFWGHIPASSPLQGSTPGKAQLRMSRQSCHSDFIALSFQKSPNWSIYSASGEVITGWVFFFFHHQPFSSLRLFWVPLHSNVLSSAIPDALSAAGLCRAKRLPKRVNCHIFTPQHLAEHIPNTLCPPAQYPRLFLCSHNASF